MANYYDDFMDFKEKFSQLSISELDQLNTLFHDFYLTQESKIYFDQHIDELRGSLVVCPVCGTTHVCKAGFDHKGAQRYKCLNDDCERKTFTLKCNTLTYYSKCTMQQWLTFFECLLHQETVAVTKEKVGICENTVLAWRHKTMYLIYKMLQHDKFNGLVEMDETLFNVQTKGKGSEVNTEEENRIKKRGISSDKISVACAIDENNHIILKVIDRGRATSKKLIETFKGIIDGTNTVVSDSLRSYHLVQKELGYTWIKIPSGKSSYDGYTLQRINSLHGNLKMFIRRMRGVSVTYLQGYLSLYELLHRYPRYYQRPSFRDIVVKILTTPMLYRGYDFTEDFSYD